MRSGAWTLPVITFPGRARQVPLAIWRVPGARWSHPRPGSGTAGHTHAGPTHARAAGPARPTLGSGARRCALVLTAESARLADGAVRLASGAPDPIGDADSRSPARPSSPPPGVGVVLVEGTCDVSRSSRPPGPGAEPGTGPPPRRGRRRDARTRRARGVCCTASAGPRAI